MLEYCKDRKTLISISARFSTWLKLMPTVVIPSISVLFFILIEKNDTFNCKQSCHSHPLRTNYNRIFLARSDPFPTIKWKRMVFHEMPLMNYFKNRTSCCGFPFCYSASMFAIDETTLIRIFCSRTRRQQSISWRWFQLFVFQSIVQLISFLFSLRLVPYRRAKNEWITFLFLDFIIIILRPLALPNICTKKKKQFSNVSTRYFESFQSSANVVISFLWMIRL